MPQYTTVAVINGHRWGGVVGDIDLSDLAFYFLLKTFHSKCKNRGPVAKVAQGTTRERFDQQQYIEFRGFIAPTAVLQICVYRVSESLQAHCANNLVTTPGNSL